MRRCQAIREREPSTRAPAQQLYQVFTVDGTQVTDIRAYPGRASALARTRGREARSAPPGPAAMPCHPGSRRASPRVLQSAADPPAGGRSSGSAPGTSQVDPRSITQRHHQARARTSRDIPAPGPSDRSRSSAQPQTPGVPPAHSLASRRYDGPYLSPGRTDRAHGCSMFARLSRHGPVPAGITRHPLSSACWTVRQVATIFGTI
jgi:hypothetical protein